MKAKTLAAIMAISFTVCALTFTELGMAFWAALAALAWSAWYANRHAKRLEGELDELFGRDEELR